MSETSSGLDIDGTAPAGKRYLFSIAIDKYESANGYEPLNNPVLDATVLSDTLIKQYGFTSIHEPLHNEKATRGAILDKLDDIELSKNDTLIVTFSGHGDILKDQGHWAAFDSKNDSRSSHVSADDILDRLDNLVEAQHIMLIIDCCFPNHIFKNNFVSRNKTNEDDIGRSRLVLASGRSEKVPDGQPNEHSPFAKALIEVLDQNHRPINGHQLVSAVRKKIGKKQKPVMGPLNVAGHEDGDFILTPMGFSEELPDGEALRKAFYDIKYPGGWWDDHWEDVFLEKINCFAIRGERYSGHLLAAKKFASGFVNNNPHYDCFYFETGNTSIANRSLWEQLGKKYGKPKADKERIAKDVFNQVKDKFCMFFLQIPHDAKVPQIEKQIATFWEELQDELFKIHQENSQDAADQSFKHLILFVMDKRGQIDDTAFQLVKRHPIANHILPAPIPNFDLKKLKVWHQRKRNNERINKGPFKTLDFSSFDESKGDFQGETTIAKICELCGLNGKDFDPYKQIFEQNQII